MKMIKLHKGYTLIFALTGALLAGCSKDKEIQEPEVLPPVAVVDNNKSPLTQKIINSSNLIKTFISDTTVNQAGGISVTLLTFKRADDLPVSMAILEVDMKNPKMEIQSLSPYNDLLYGLQPVMDMARDNEKAGSKIIAAINGDTFNSSSGEPTGVYYLNGIGLKTTIPTAGGTFFSIYSDKSIVIGGKDAAGVLRPIDNTKIKYAIGSRQWLVDKGVKVNNTDGAFDARTAIGYTADKVVYAVIADGGQVNFSNGLSLANLSDVMVAFGVRDAVNLDGGISSTAVIRDSSGAAKWNLLNRPTSLNGRNVANSLAFVLKD